MGEHKSLLEVIIKEMRSAAEEEAQKILKEAEAEAQKILEDARAKAESLRKEKLNQLVFEYRQKLLSEIAPMRLELKRKYIQEKHRLVENQVDELIMEVMNEITGSSDTRKAFLVKVLIDAVASMASSDLVINPCYGSKEIIPDVLEEVKPKLLSLKPNLRIEVSTPIECREGAVITSRDGREIYNATLEAKIKEVRESVLPKIMEQLSKK
jgi:V/A-type H+-transporting ATPase subunit E